MKRKHITIAIILFIIILVAIIYLISQYGYSTENSKIIYSYSREDDGFIPIWTNIEIYNNGQIKRRYKRYNEDEKIITRKISKKELNSIRKLIYEVENSKLFKEKSTGVGILFSNTDIYISLNKKIELTGYTNEEVEELEGFVKKLKEKYLKEE